MSRNGHISNTELRKQMNHPIITFQSISCRVDPAVDSHDDSLPID